MKRSPALTLAGRVVLVTGAAGGIGTATARALVGAGSHVVLVDLHRPPLDALARSLGPRALPVAADVTDSEALHAAVAAAVARYGSLDVCFANAGVAPARPTTIRASPVREFERIIEVDVLGVWRTVRACLPEITKAGGHVLVTSSVYAFFNGTTNAPYAMSKAAIESFGRSLRGELAGTGTTAGVLYPGWVDTPIIKGQQEDPAVRQLIRLATPGPFGAPVTAERVAGAVVKGIEARSTRIICPRRWAPVSAARGVVNMLSDAVVDRSRPMQSLIRRLDA
ncbi:short-chain dehydrogenase/reductase [Streptomyces rubiginosohelvolus]|uniref:Short-chain dehydrogenase/reductase n=1 Tax=Streptomyces rubiginosohelvolus TaxID=67362 RepID=A0ABW6EV96_9ACTN